MVSNKGELAIMVTNDLEANGMVNERRFMASNTGELAVMVYNG